MQLGAEAPRHLDLDLRHPDLPLAGVVRETHRRVSHEAQHGLLMLREAPVQVVRVGLRDPPAPSLGAWRDLGQFPRALCQDGPVSLDDTAAFGRGQRLGRASVDPVAGVAKQRLHQARPAVVVGVDGEGEFAEEVRAAQLVPAASVGQVGLPAVMDQRTGVARDDADLLDGLPSAPAVQALQRQGSVGEDVEPLRPAVDPEAGLVGVQGRAFQEPRDGGLLPRSERVVKAPDVAQAGGLG